MDALRGADRPFEGRGLPRDETFEEAVALLTLRDLPDVGFARMERLLRAFGSGREALAAPSKPFRSIAGGRADGARSEGARSDRARHSVQRALDTGVLVVPRGSPDFPRRLLHLAQPPVLLFLRGNEALLRGPTVAVVGSRRSSAYGRRVAAETARVLAAHGVVVGSGLALGIDGAAHRAALDAGGATLAVLGSGIDVAHPPSNRGLFERISRAGLLVTEFAPGTPPLPHHFPRRNRILAGLAEGVLVVEAAERSGALITADLALELGRTVMAVPGPVFAPRSVGTNRMIRDGAAILTEPDDVLATLDRGMVGMRGDPGEIQPPDLGADAAAVWSALAAGACRVDELARGSGLEASQALAVLATLELSGWVDREPGMRFVRRGGRGSSGPRPTRSRD